MQFDFKRFSDIVAKLYEETVPLYEPIGWKIYYSLNETLGVFHYYFQKFEECMRHPHPPIKREQIFRIIEEMPCTPIMGGERGFAEIDAEKYKDIIDLHFKTRYRRCDYNINHFFSGKIRELRLHELGDI